MEYVCQKYEEMNGSNNKMNVITSRVQACMNFQIFGIIISHENKTRREPDDYSHCQQKSLEHPTQHTLYVDYLDRNKILIVTENPFVIIGDMHFDDSLRICLHKVIDHNKTERRLNTWNNEHDIMPQMIKISDQLGNNAVLSYY